MEDIVLEFRIRFESARMIFLQFQTRLFFLNDRVRFSLGLPVCFFFSFSVGRCVLHALDSEPQKTNEIPRIRHNIDDWPPCPGFGPKNGQKGTKTNPKTAYSKNHDGHINYLPTCFTKKKKNIRHPRFPRGPPPQYWSGPMVLNFAVRMGCGVSTMVWSNDGIYVFVTYAEQKTKKLVNRKKICPITKKKFVQQKKLVPQKKFFNKKKNCSIQKKKNIRHPRFGEFGSGGTSAKW